jgi:alkanesulfonate monooxygenase SsuD/methylene tetrahydromethanopterin reductase-like flavin-dependent oxidoreductase (luciferase family)
LTKVGVFVPQATFYPDMPSSISIAKQYQLALQVAREAEQLGFDSIWAWDFAFANLQPLAQSHTRLAGSSFEPWILLSSLVNETKHIRLGQMVSCNTYRHPSLLCAMATTLDVASNGRLEFGIGAGWNAQYGEFGLAFPKPSIRIKMVEEAIQIIKLLWTGDSVTFKGEFYTLKEAHGLMKPVQKPYPPILVGGGQNGMLRVIAKHADKFNYFCTLDEYAGKIEKLRQYSEDFGRRFEDIEKTLTADIVIGKDQQEVEEKLQKFKRQDALRADYDAFSKRRITGTPDQCAETLKRFSDLGVTEFVLYFPDASDLGPLQLFASRVLPSIR